MKYAIIIPTFNGGALWHSAIAAINMQQPKPDRVLVIDSGSIDDTVQACRDGGFEVIEIPNSDFDHGGTRQMAVDCLDGIGLVVMLTQDAVLESNDSIRRLLQAFKDEELGAAFGRQVPRLGASPIESHARLFNYPQNSTVRSKRDISELGLKTAFCSNSFSAWRQDALNSVGGFPGGMIFAEDMYVAAKMILAGKRVAYVADAVCVHSHHYSLKEDFQRAFDIGVFHNRETWLIQEFGRAEGEGKSFVISELNYILRSNALYIPISLVKTMAKILGYFMGKNEHLLSAKAKHAFSLNKNFWMNQSAKDEASSI